MVGTTYYDSFSSRTEEFGEEFGTRGLQCLRAMSFCILTVPWNKSTFLLGAFMGYVSTL